MIRSHSLSSNNFRLMYPSYQQALQFYCLCKLVLLNYIFIFKLNLLKMTTAPYRVYEIYVIKLKECPILIRFKKNYLLSDTAVSKILLNHFRL